jgi:thiol-disulfide isomerase/thioredoxin
MSSDHAISFQSGRRSKLRLLLPVLAIVSAFPVFAARAPKDRAEARIAPQFSLPGRAGTVALNSLRGHVVYVDFWASWCDPCRKSFPWLRALHDRFSAKGLVIVAINLDKDRDAAEEFLKRFPAPFLVAFDPSGSAAKAFDVPAMPSSYLIGPTGAILHSVAGFDPKKSGAVESEIEEALSQ